MGVAMNFSLPAAPMAQPSVAKKEQECPLCGFCFDAAQAACSGCAMIKGCSMIKCPNCHYEFVTESKIVNWFQKLFRKRG